MADLSILSKQDLQEVLKPLVIEALSEFTRRLPNSGESPLLTREEAADLLRISLPTLLSWEKDGTIPKPKRLGKRVYFIRKDFIAFLESDNQ